MTELQCKAIMFAIRRTQVNTCREIQIANDKEPDDLETSEDSMKVIHGYYELVKSYEGLDN